MIDHENNEQTYYQVRNSTPSTELENAQRFYYLRKTCFRGMMRYNQRGVFNVPFGRYKSCNFDDLKNIDYETLLKRTEIFNKDFEYIFNHFNDRQNFMFLDPPYDSRFTNYGFTTFGKEQHIKLANLFKQTKIRCLMVIGKTDFIYSLYKDYVVDEYEKKYRFKLHSSRVGSEINTTHIVVRNFDM